MANLTGGQIQEVLDTCINQALKPIILCSDIFDSQISYLINCAATNKKRKVSALDREHFISMMCNAYIESDKERKWNIITSCKIERRFIYMFVVNFLEYTKGYASDYSKWITAKNEFDRDRFDAKLSVLENEIYVSRNDMLQCIQTCNDYLELAYEFRNSIVKQYIKHCYKQAVIFCNDKPNYSISDVGQNFVTAVTKALDKYDSSKGALTSYINYWILDAQTYGNSEHGHEYGIAYTIPVGRKRDLVKNGGVDNNFSVSLDQLVGDDSELIDLIGGNVDDEAQKAKEDEYRIIQYLVKHADENGIARLYLGIDEYFSNKELGRMERHMIKELGREAYMELRFGKTVNSTMQVVPKSNRRNK